MIVLYPLMFVVTFFVIALTVFIIRINRKNKEDDK